MAALWNGQDAILKDQLFGLSGAQGNHGEDVKEIYYLLDNTPTHSYQKLLYKYPQQAFPYEQLVQENARRTRKDPEFELLDTGIFAENRYFDVFIEYAKADAEDLLIQLTIVNRGPEEASLHVLPQLWFRNTWAWGYPGEENRPTLAATPDGTVQVTHRDLSELTWYAEGGPDWLFCDNNSNTQRLYGTPSEEPFFKDGINNYIVDGQQNAVNPARTGTKAAAHYPLVLAAGATQQVRLRLGPAGQVQPFADFGQLLQQRQAEADAFYAAIQCDIPDADARNVQRQAFAGMLWSKQYYNYNVPRWLVGGVAHQP
ncbi:MAG: glucosidase, partial [Hymenobacter sp.]